MMETTARVAAAAHADLFLETDGVLGADVSIIDLQKKIEPL